MSVCCCSLAGTAACRSCSNNPYCETPPPVRTTTIIVADNILITGKKTNADRIRSMTDEELADWFIEIQDDVADYYDGGHAVAPELPTMKNSWLDWLKQECE